MTPANHHQNPIPKPLAVALDHAGWFEPITDHAPPRPGEGRVWWSPCLSGRLIAYPPKSGGARVSRYLLVLDYDYSDGAYASRIWRLGEADVTAAFVRESRRLKRTLPLG